MGVVPGNVFFGGENLNFCDKYTWWHSVVASSVFSKINIWSMIYSMQRELHTLKALENKVLNSENCVPVFQNRFVVISDFRLTGHTCNIVRLTLCCTGNQKLTAQLAKTKSWQSPSVDVTPLEILEIEWILALAQVSLTALLWIVFQFASITRQTVFWASTALATWIKSDTSGTTCGVRDGVVQNYLVPSCSR